MEKNILQQGVKNNSLQWWKIVLLCLRQLILAILVLFGIPVFTAVGFKLLQEFNLVIAYQLVVVGPQSVGAWILLLAIVAWYPIILAVWMARDAIKFKKQGMRAMPFLWAIGMIFPIIFELFSIYLIQRGIIVGPFLGAIGMIPFVVFSIYFILSDVFWSRRLKNNVNIVEQEKTKKWPVPSKRAREISLSGVAIAFVVFVVVTITDLPQILDKTLNKRRTDEQVAKIHATKLTLDDVTGKNLPPEPGQKLNDSTIEGIDANQNGIRDDVELAIFKLYPDSARIRAAELQYALALQNELSNVFNSETLVATMQEEGRGSLCIKNTVPPRTALDSSSTITSNIALISARVNEVEDLVINTEMRKSKQKEIYQKYMTSYGNIEKEDCDIDLISLPN